MGLPVALGDCFVLSIFNVAPAMNLDSVDSSQIRSEIQSKINGIGMLQVTRSPAEKAD